MKRFFIVCFSLVVAICSVYSGQMPEDNLLLSTEPIFFGEENFIQRINERKGSEREAVGLVLTGGSARALAHIGVLKYLEEKNIVPDFIVSNSMGSIVALLYAAGLSPDQIQRLCTSADLGALFDISLPLGHGLLETFGFENLLYEILGKNLRLEELEIPVMIICEDIKTKRQVRICEGDFYKIFTASYALPVYFTPIEFEGCLLIDGGVANIAPLGAAYKYSSNIIVSTTFYNGKNTNLYNPITVLNNAIDIGKRRKGVEELLSHEDVVWIRCNVEDFSFMDFASADVMAENGYKSAQEQEEKLDFLALTFQEEYVERIKNTLEQKRDDYDEVLSKIIKKLLSGGQLKLHNSVIYPSFYFDSSHFSILTDGMLIGLGIKTGVGRFESFLGPAFSFVANTREARFEPELGIYFSMDIFSFGNLKGSFSYLPWKNFKAMENLNFYLYSSKSFVLSLGENMEYLRKNELSSLVLSSYINADINFKNGGKLVVRPAFELVNKKAGFSFNAAFSANIASALGVSLDSTVRYIGKPTECLNLDFGAKIFWRNTDYKPTVAEMIILSDVRLGAFADFAFKDLTHSPVLSPRPDLIVGMFFSADSNLIGLVKMPFEIKVGYDFLMEEFYFSFAIY